MNDKRHDSVLYSLDRTIELLTRTPEAHGPAAAALDALKKARTEITAAFARENAAPHVRPRHSEIQV